MPYNSSSLRLRFSRDVNYEFTVKAEAFVGLSVGNSLHVNGNEALIYSIEELPPTPDGLHLRIKVRYVLRAPDPEPVHWLNFHLNVGGGIRCVYSIKDDVDGLDELLDISDRNLRLLNNRPQAERLIHDLEVKKRTDKIRQEHYETQP